MNELCPELNPGIPESGESVCCRAGERDNRILVSNDPSANRKMVWRMAETAQMSGGYMIYIGEHIP